MQTENKILHFLPLVIGAMSSMSMIVARILTNRFIKEYQYKIAKETFEKIKTCNDEVEKEKLFQERELGVISNPPPGTIPIIYSTIYLAGFIGLIASFVWAFVSIAWWASVIIFFFYMFTGLVASLMRIQRR